MSDRHAPPLGGDAGPIYCSRLLDFPDPASRCTNEAIAHVMWNARGDNGLACELHAQEAMVSYKFVAIHAYQMTCSMPGALWVLALNRCIVDEDFLFAEETANAEQHA